MKAHETPAKKPIMGMEMKNCGNKRMRWIYGDSLRSFQYSSGSETFFSFSREDFLQILLLNTTLFMDFLFVTAILLYG